MTDQQIEMEKQRLQHELSAGQITQEQFDRQMNLMLQQMQAELAATKAGTAQTYAQTNKINNSY